MKLTINDLKALVSGAVEILEEDGAVAFRRFAAAQGEKYMSIKNSDGFYKKTFATAGVRLEVTTDAAAVAFRYLGKVASSRKFCLFDVYVNDVLVALAGQEDVPESCTGEFRLELPEGENKLTIYFPNLYDLRLADVELEGATFATPCGHQYSMVSYGDSITQGYDARHPSLSYVNQMAAALDATVVDKAIGGDIFFPELLDVNDGMDPDLVTVAYGTNDWRKCTREQFLMNMTGFFKKLHERYPAAKVFAITPIWRGNYLSAVSAVGEFSEVAEMIRAEAEKYGFHVVDGMSLTPHEPTFFAPDVLHPNDIGHLWYGRRLADEIRKYL